MKRQTYNIGDHCQVKQYSEYLSGFCARIVEEPSFVNEMECLCGMEFTISSVEQTFGFIYYHSVEGIEYCRDINDASAFWYITPCMLELIEPAEDADDELLSAIIGG